MSDVNLRQSTWVVAFARQVQRGFDVGTAQQVLQPHRSHPPGHRFEPWCDATLHARGLILGTPTPCWQPDTPDPGQPEWVFLNLLTHQLELLGELRLLYGGHLHGAPDRLAMLAVLAAHASELETAEALWDLSLEDWGERGDPERDKLAQALTPHAILLGRRLREHSLPDVRQPLVGLPFHDVLVYVGVRQLLAIGRVFFRSGGRPDMHEIPPILAQTQMLKVHMIEAVIGLALADHKVTRVERRLIDAVIDMARLPPEDRDMVLEALEHPPSVSQLGAWIREPLDRRFLYTQLQLNAVIEEQAESLPERAYLDDLAQAFDIDTDEQIALQSEALTFLDAHPELVDAFSLGETLRRFRGGLTRRVEATVKHNLGRLVTEIKETGELAVLLAKRSTGRLDAAEEAKVRKQVLDICKTVPSLAIFALPGGAVLLPIVLKLIPNLLPSAFADKQEKI